jgi:hypothetical protein
MPTDTGRQRTDYEDGGSQAQSARQLRDDEAQDMESQYAALFGQQNRPSGRQNTEREGT